MKPEKKKSAPSPKTGKEKGLPEGWSLEDPKDPPTPNRSDLARKAVEEHRAGRTTPFPE